MHVDPEFTDDAVHGGRDCNECHGGDPAGEDRETSHVGMVRDPSLEDPEGTCGICHVSILDSWQNSVHNSLQGFRYTMSTRSGSATLGTELETAFENHCSKCHASCGQCHFSVPTSSGGGFLSGHKKTNPKMVSNCTACHGSRVGDEYRGQNTDEYGEAITADVHSKKGMQCLNCHSSDEMHGVGAASADHRYQITSLPKCEDCHDNPSYDSEMADAFAAVSAHFEHQDTNGDSKLSCQVCHSTTYKNCYSCHVSLDSGTPVYEVNEPFDYQSVMSFKIGYNPLFSPDRPYTHVLLRHIPIDLGSYQFYGDGLLGSFDSLPTWKYATPHNIQRETPQNESCNSCHGNDDIFLLPADLLPEEVAANAGVVVPSSPAPRP